MRKLFRSSENVEIQGENESVTKKIVSNGKEMSESLNDTYTVYASVEHLQNKHKSASDETTLVSEIQDIMNEENVIISAGQVMDCEEQAFSHLLPKG